jgi:hypothetical protein
MRSSSSLRLVVFECPWCVPGGTAPGQTTRMCAAHRAALGLKKLRPAKASLAPPGWRTLPPEIRRAYATLIRGSFAAARRRGSFVIVVVLRLLLLTYGDFS